MLIIYTTTVFSGTIDPNIPDEKYTTYAQNFPFIGQICVEDKYKNKIYGSVVAYKPNIIITAAHLFYNYEHSIVIFDPIVVMVEKVIIHEKFDYDQFGENDIAVVLLHEEIKLSSYPELYDSKDELNKVCKLSGFGNTGNFYTGSFISDHKKRAGTNKIEKINNHLLFLSASNINKTPLEFLIASGDSGGGLFINNKLAGIHSGVINQRYKKKSDYYSSSTHTRISSFTTWIEDNINKLCQ